MDESIDEPGIRVATTRFGDTLLVRVDGEIAMSTVGVLRSELVTAAYSRPAVLLVDLSGIDFLTSPGVSALLEAHERALRDGAAFAVVAWQTHVLHSLRVTDVDGAVPVYPALTAAMAAIATSSQGSPPTAGAGKGGLDDAI